MLDIYRALTLSSFMLLASCGGSTLLLAPPEEINLAINKEATQSSTLAGGEPEYAIDGNTDGIYRNDSVTHTNAEFQPWWQVDLGSIESISNINVYNRTDDCCVDRLADFYLLISEDAFESTDLQETIDQTNVKSYHFESIVDTSTSFEVNVAGRYVRIQLAGTDNELSLAEVEIIEGDEIDVEEPILVTDPTPEPEIVSIPSPLARLSNNEFVNSVRSVLNLSKDSPNIEAAIPLMASEAVTDGLTSDSNAQGFSAATINGYIAIAEAAANDFIGESSTLAELEEKMQCDVLEALSGRNNYTHLICTRDYFRTFVEKLYGTEYTDDNEYFDTFIGDIETYVTAAGLESESFETTQFRLQVMFSYMFLVPEFLVFIEEQADSPSSSGDRLSSIEIAKRLAFFLTGTLPDEPLRTAALNDTLTDANIRLEHAIRLLEDSAVNEQFAEFFVAWLGVSIENDQVEQEDIDALKVWLTNWFGNSQPFSDLYSSNTSVIDINGVENDMNVGVLGFKAFVASMTNNPVPSFINRGDFVVTQLLCAQLPDDIPSAAFETSATVSETPEDLFHELSTHGCATCHHIADNYGAVFQQFTSEESLFNPELFPYGTSFDLFPIGDFQGEFSDLVTFGQSLGQSQSAAECASKLLYRHSVRRSLDESGKDDQAIEAMYSSWVNSGDTSIKSLLRSIVTSDHFITRFN